MNNFEKVRNYLNTRHGLTKFIIRILYPVTLYCILYFGSKALGIKNIQAVQIVFIAIWSVSEYFLFFRRN